MMNKFSLTNSKKSVIKTWIELKPELLLKERLATGEVAMQVWRR